MSEHWTVKYQDREYKPGRYVCSDFVEEVQRVEFNNIIHLPKPNTDSVREMSALIEGHRLEFATLTDSPIEGDAVIMIGRGRLNHVGVYVLLNGVPWVIHNMRGIGVVFGRIRELPAAGLTVEGYYRWK